MFDDFDQPTGITMYGWRSWFYMLLNFGLGTAYLTFMSIAYPLGFGLSIIWIGLPILALALSLTRRVARFDRWLAAKMMGMQLPTVPDDLNIQSSNPLHMVGAHLSSATTWQDAIYLLMKFPLGLTSFMMAMLTFPFLGLETVLSVFGIHIGSPVAHIVRAMASGMSGALGGLTPAAEPARQQQRRYVSVPRDQDDDQAYRTEYRSEKAKRRLEVDDDPDAGYYIDDDGEIALHKRKNR